MLGQICHLTWVLAPRYNLMAADEGHSPQNIGIEHHDLDAQPELFSFHKVDTHRSILGIHAARSLRMNDPLSCEVCP
jgi:hypothetical protein